MTEKNIREQRKRLQPLAQRLRQRFRAQKQRRKIREIAADSGVICAGEQKHGGADCFVNDREFFSSLL